MYFIYLLDMPCGSSPTRGAPALVAQSPNHWATREGCFSPLDSFKSRNFTLLRKHRFFLVGTVDGFCGFNSWGRRYDGTQAQSITQDAQSTQEQCPFEPLPELFLFNPVN